MNGLNIEGEAWWAFVRSIQLWKQRGAPSVGAMAASITRNRMLREGEIRAIIEALGLYLADWQRSERFIAQPKRGGLQSFGGLKW